uniref:Uncharacterized protein n=1 Tax=Meloidogyne graminicola TaxID=189291 RepID=A0A2R4SDF6_9BILA|nr:hypothetical protein [Meloidogyne graminicola]
MKNFFIVALFCLMITSIFATTKFLEADELSCKGNEQECVGKCCTDCCSGFYENGTPYYYCGTNC